MTIKKDYPILEFDCTREAVIEQHKLFGCLDIHKFPYIKAKTWTTDAFYRETREKVELRRSEGCVSVEMECAAFCAVAKFRDVSFGQILYGGDDLSCE